MLPLLINRSVERQGMLAGVESAVDAILTAIFCYDTNPRSQHISFDFIAHGSLISAKHSSLKHEYIARHIRKRERSTEFQRIITFSFVPSCVRAI